ncbi:MAG: amino acid/amide transporter ATP-binding protein 1, family / amino acid/amide, partial [Nocardioides sp.]|nr:amino acid/amide transporter ATP-binding protein 1, family / amino acid/amide [Nocardioides sp.]
MSYYADVAIGILILMTLGVSLNLLLGYAGRVSMAHAVFFGIGGFTAARLTLPSVEELGGVATAGLQTGASWGWFPALLAAMVIAFLAALLISIPAVRLVRGEYLILLTLAFQLVAFQLMGVMDSVTGGPYGLSGIPPMSIGGTLLIRPEQFFWVMLAAAVLTFAACWALGESPFGRLLK